MLQAIPMFDSPDFQAVFLSHNSVNSQPWSGRMESIRHEVQVIEMNKVYFACLCDTQENV